MGNKLLWQCHLFYQFDIKRINNLVKTFTFGKEEVQRNKHGKDKMLKVE